MTLGMIALSASILVILGVIIGWRLNQWQLEARARQQAAAQLSLYEQLQELQAARKKDYPATSNPGNPANGSRHRAA